MRFRPSMAARVRDGRKTVTRRFGSEERMPYRAGRDYALQESAGGLYNAVTDPTVRLHVASVTWEPLRLIELAGEAQLEGFRSVESFLRYWQLLHHKPADLEAMVWRIRFEPIATHPESSQRISG